jgi:hypothetical protein
MTDTTNDLALTKLDIQAMRRADRVAVSHLRGAGLLRLIRGEGDRTRETQIPVPSRVDSYRDYRPGEPAGDPDRECTCHHSADVYHSIPSYWESVAAFARAGDVVSLRWIEDNNNQHVKQAGLHVDGLEVRIKRGSRVYAFLIYQTAGNPGDCARMIRR